MAGVVGVMTDEQAGKLLKAILTYVNGSDPEFDDPVAMVAFQPVRMQLERDHQSYVNTVIRNRENGRKGGRPKKTQENPVGYLGNPNKPKKADTDTDTDKENVKGKRKFKPPTRDQVIDYFVEKGYTKDSGAKAFEYYDIQDWKDANGKAVKNWKAKMLAVWFKDENKEKSGNITAASIIESMRT